MSAQAKLSEPIGKTGATRRETLEQLQKATGNRHELLIDADAFPDDYERAITVYNLLKQGGAVSWSEMAAFEQVSGFTIGTDEALACFDIERTLKEVANGRASSRSSH